MKCKCGHDQNEHGSSSGVCFHFALGVFCRCDMFKPAPKPRRRAKPFARWSVVGGCVLFDGHMMTAEQVVSALNRCKARVVLPKRGRS